MYTEDNKTLIIAGIFLLSWIVAWITILLVQPLLDYFGIYALIFGCSVIMLIPLVQIKDMLYE